MNRREILKASIMAPIAAALAPVLGCLKRNPEPKTRVDKGIEYTSTHYGDLMRRLGHDNEWVDADGRSSPLVMTTTTNSISTVTMPLASWESEPPK